MNNKRLIVVLGMHRSGTSAITRGLKVLGVELSDRLISSIENNNEKGFWEDIEINSLNNEILHTLGSAWHYLSPIKPDDVEVLHKNGYLLRAKALLCQKINDAPVFGFKDPRVSKLLPFWQDVFSQCQIDVSFVWAIRNPLSVAESLTKRDGFDKTKSYLLWLGHIIAILSGIVGRRTILIDYDHLIQFPDFELKRLAKQFALNIDPIEMQIYINEFLDKELRHNIYDVNDLLLDNFCPSLVSEIYTELLEVASDKKNIEDPSLKKKVSIWIHEFERLKSTLALIDRISIKNNDDALIESSAQLNITITELTQTKTRLNETKIDLNKNQTELNKTKTELNKTITDRDKILASTSWRMTAPLREIKTYFKRLNKDILQMLLTFLRQIYHTVPLPLNVKIKLAHSLLPFLKPLLNGTSLYPRNPHKQNYGQSLKNKSLMSKGKIDFEEIIRNIDNPQIGFADSSTPNISIIIPVFNNIEHTFNCLKSIFENTGGNFESEIIIVDDCSNDETQKVLSKIKGIRILNNATNIGFLNSCNFAALQARGDFLIFLNNDTMVRPGWLYWLVKTFEMFPDVGLVGAKLIFPEGRLQEAGGIVWQDGSANNYGRMDDPDKPEYNYAREVDYCSGACIMIPRKLFIDLGMFSTEYSPAYYEDTDLAFKVRARKKKVIYQPKCEVIHYEGITSGNDISNGIKQYQSINQVKFFNRWQDVLSSHAPRGVSMEFEKERFIKKRMLVIDECICMPDQDSGSLRMFYMIKIIREMGYKISFFPRNQYYPEPYTGNMQALGVEVLADSYTGAMEQYLRNYGYLFDVVILSRLRTASSYIDMVRCFCGKAKIIFDTVDLHFLREQRGAEVKGGSLHLVREAEKIKRHELNIAAKADLTLVVSPVEKDIINREAPSISVAIVSNIHQVVGSNKPFSERKDIFFIGGFRHPPNVDAVIYFVHTIFPLIQKKINGIKFYIIGSNPPPQISKLATENVIVTGFVEDVVPYMNQCRISVAPLLWGAGIKGKINQSMSYGVPAVATSVAAEGMQLTNNTDILIADDAKGFAEAVIRLYTQEDLWNQLSDNGLKNVNEHFSIEAGRKALASILSETDKEKFHLNPEDNKLAARLIAFYLPQFHPIPENDQWWGKGFSEWHNCSKSKPLFKGHHQPNLPSDLGFYDLRVPDVREQQAELAKKYGIEGFCYWHYWFKGKLLLERPVLDMIESGKPDFPFCLAWANEPWSRRWTGEAMDVLQAQEYGGDEDHLQHFKWLLPAFKDPRAITIDGKPVFLIYKANQIPDINKMLTLWRELALKHGLPGLYLMSIETTGTFDEDPRQWGFDAAVEFQPRWKTCGIYLHKDKQLFYRFIYRIWALDYRNNWPTLLRILDYRKLWPKLLMKKERPYPFYPGIFPRWDNTPRMGAKGLVLLNSSPEEYGKWLNQTIKKLSSRSKEHRIIFINAWNEWAEGNYLEPDMKFGHAYLQETYRANLKIHNTNDTDI